MPSAVCETATGLGLFKCRLQRCGVIIVSAMSTRILNSVKTLLSP
jgi:hypothetical protein